ncbi:MAG: hypothetical protein HKO58_07370 [Gammaproteobacteria bacterium]|nr:hypothetical protein [Gammaproteobacteria bacterium]
MSSPIKKGDFHCPNCRSVQNFELKRVRDFVTFYQVPLIPLNQLGDYVECLACKDTYKPLVLDSDRDLSKSEFEAEYHSAIKTVMLLMLLIDNKLRQAEFDMVQQVYQRLTRKSISIEQLKREASLLKGQEYDLKKTLRRLQGNLNDEGKELVLKAAFYVAMADGEFQDAEQEYLAKIASDLGMSPAHFQGVISTA